MPKHARTDFPDYLDEPFKPALTSARCPKCGSADLELNEVIKAKHTWVVKNGRLNRNAGYHDTGYSERVEGVANC